MTTTQESIVRRNIWVAAVQDEERLEEGFLENDRETVPLDRPVRFKAFGIPGFRARTKR
jgi:hypothetical protein